MTSLLPTLVSEIRSEKSFLLYVLSDSMPQWQKAYHGYRISILILQVSRELREWEWLCSRKSEMIVSYCSKSTLITSSLFLTFYLILLFSCSYWSKSVREPNAWWTCVLIYFPSSISPLSWKHIRCTSVIIILPYCLHFWQYVETQNLRKDELTNKLMVLINRFSQDIGLLDMKCLSI